MKPYNSTAVIFAGGKSSRMGTDKALLPFGTHPTLAAFQYEKLQKLFADVYISTKEEKFDFKAKLIKDIYKESSPLVGLLSVFKTHDIEEVFVLSVDTPFVDEDTIARIMHIDMTAYDAIIAKSPHGLHPLCGRYGKSILPLLKQCYTQDNHRLQNVLHQAKTCTLCFDDDSPFANLNHPQEYNEALKRLL